MNFLTVESLQVLLGVDLVLFIVCTNALYFRGGLSFTHPAFIFLLYHFYCNSFRLFSIINGAATMYEDMAHQGYETVTFSEIGRAMVWMDVGLVLFTLACLVAYNHTPTRRSALIRQFRSPPVALNPQVVIWVCAVCFPIGLFFFLAKRGGLEVDLGELGNTSYASVFSMWPLACVASAIYVWGFRWWLMLPLVAYLGVVSLQGYHRFMLLLPVILITVIYVFRNNRRWPPFPFAIFGILLFAIFPYLKYIGRAYIEGDWTMVKMLLTEGTTKVLKGDKDTSQDFLDQFACAMTLTDRNGKVYYGANYAALLSYPVPRVLWPEKPTVVQFMIDFETRERPMKTEGRIVTWMGDAYVNFREVGMILYPLLLGYFLSRWALSSTLLPHLSLTRYVFVVFAPAFLQVWRDGLCSLAFFTFIHFMPVMFIVLIHFIPSVRKKILPIPQKGEVLGPNFPLPNPGRPLLRSRQRPL